MTLHRPMAFLSATPFSYRLRTPRSSHASTRVPPSQKATGGSQSATKDTVTVTFRGREISAQRGQKLRAVLLNAGVHPHNGGLLVTCRGLGTCGTCAVAIHDGNVHPAERSFRENVRLNFPPHHSTNTEQRSLRLACQVRLEENITVTKFNGFWGQGAQQLPHVEQIKGTSLEQ